MDLPLLVDKRASDTKLLDARIALETGHSDSIFYPYRPHREDLTTRFGFLFYNDKIIIPEAMRSTLIANLHQGHVSVNEMDQSAEGFWGPGSYLEIKERAEVCQRCRDAGKKLKRKYRIQK